MDEIICYNTFYKPGEGVLKEYWFNYPGSWASFSYYDTNGFPDCPSKMENIDTFHMPSQDLSQSLTNIIYRYRAFYIAPQNGGYQFQGYCNNYCRIFFGKLPADMTKIAEQYSSCSTWTCLNSQTFTLKKDFRYYIEVHHGANMVVDYFGLGVRLPDGNTQHPISKSSLRRSTCFYKWKGLLREMYTDIGPSYVISSLTSSAKYPDNPSIVACESTLEPRYNIADNYGLRFTGYFHPLVDGIFKFRMQADNAAELYLTINNVETKIGEDPSYPGGWEEFPSKTLLSNTTYLMKVLFKEGGGGDFVRVQYSANSGSFSYFQANTLTNLKNEETFCEVQAPSATAINTTAILINYRKPVIAPDDNFILSSIKLVYNEQGQPEASVVLDSSKQNYVLSGLKGYTTYSFKLQHFGNIYNIETGATTQQTLEGVPSQGPTFSEVKARSSTKIRAKWNIIPAGQVNGILTGYKLQYSLDKSPRTWISTTVGSTTRQKEVTGLSKYTVYVFKVAGMTSKGTGTFSAEQSERTDEDKPSQAPQGLHGYNTSSTEIFLEWTDPPEEHKNGIITEYKVFYKLSSAGGWSTKIVSTPNINTVVSGLYFWSDYQFKVAASTSKGYGPESYPLVTVRTDEDKPTGSPNNVAGRAETSSSINITWADITPSLTNGIIVSYKVQYERKDGGGTVQLLVVPHKTALLTGLDEYVVYKIKVAGMTKKGVGVFSTFTEVRTKEDRPHAPPTSVNGRNTSSTSLSVQWGPIPSEHQNGIIIQYHIWYRQNQSENTDWFNTSVNSAKTSVNISGLIKFTFYEIKVAGATSVGIGNQGNPILVQTDADGPSSFPQNLTGEFLNESAITVEWSFVPEKYRHGIILGYKLALQDTTLLNSTWMNHTVNSMTYSLNVTGLKIYTIYRFRISAFTLKGFGPWSPYVVIRTGQATPAPFPKNVSGSNTSSTSIRLEWTPVPEAHNQANGKVLGYYVYCRVVDCYEDRPKGCNENQVFNYTTPDANASITIEGLRKYTNYSCRTQVYNIYGAGKLSPPIHVRTAEDRPDAPPKKLETFPGTPGSIKVFWNPIDESLRNGIIIGYGIFYRPLYVPLRHYNRAPRSVSSFAALGALPGEKVKVVNGSQTETVLEGLEQYRWYHIRIGGITSKGLGVTISINGTCEQKVNVSKSTCYKICSRHDGEHDFDLILGSVVPCRKLRQICRKHSNDVVRQVEVPEPTEAPVLFIKDQYDFYEITVQWNETSYNSSRGEVLGYKVRYWPQEINDEAVFQPAVSELNIPAPGKSVVLKELTPFTKYGIQILSYTEGGFGIISEISWAETCRCSSTFSTSLMQLMPLVGNPLSSNVNKSGILPRFVEDATRQCCSSCSQKTTTVSWNYDSDGLNALKNSREEVMSAIERLTHISVPFLSKAADLEDIMLNPPGSFGFVPIVVSPGVAQFTRKMSQTMKGNKWGENLILGIRKNLPFYIIACLMTMAAGIILWTLERGINGDEFAETFFRGSCSGMWLAYITMTTAGYGDIAPKTNLARLFAVIWTLIGLVITSIIMGFLIDSMTVSVMTDDSTHRIKVLATNDTAIIALKMRAEVVSGDTSDPNFVKEALLSERVDKALIESFIAAEYRHIFDHPDIVLEGIVQGNLAYGIALNGEAKRLTICMKRYFSEHQSEILWLLSKQLGPSEKLTPNTAVEKAKNFLSPHADLTFNLLFYMGIALGCLAFLGALYDIHTYVKRKERRVRSNVDYFKRINKHEAEINQVVKNFITNFTKTVKDLEKIHIKDRLQMSKNRGKALTDIAPELASIFDKSKADASADRRDDHSLVNREITK